MSIFYESPFGDANDKTIERFEAEQAAKSGYFDPRDSGLNEFERLMDMARTEEREGAASLIQSLQREVEHMRGELHHIKRTAEMSAGIMRDPRRTGGWMGAENTARAFDRIAERAALFSRTSDACAT